MLQVVFTNVPKDLRTKFKYKKWLTGGHGRKLSAKEASQIIKEVAEKFEPGQEVRISYTLIDDDKHEYSVYDAPLTADDAISGLVNLQDKVAETIKKEKSPKIEHINKTKVTQQQLQQAMLEQGLDR